MNDKRPRASDTELMTQRLQQLEQFYRAWLKRLCDELPRHVPGERLACCQAALLRDLEAELDGAALVRCVLLLLARLTGLASSEVPGARYVFDALVRQGLTPSLIQQISTLAMLARAEAGWQVRRQAGSSAGARREK